MAKTTAKRAAAKKTPKAQTGTVRKDLKSRMGLVFRKGEVIQFVADRDSGYVTARSTITGLHTVIPASAVLVHG